MVAVNAEKMMKALIDDVAEKKDVLYVAMVLPKQGFLMTDMMARRPAFSWDGVETLMWYRYF